MLQETALRSLKMLLPKGQVFIDRASLLAYEVDAGLDRGLPEGGLGAGAGCTNRLIGRDGGDGPGGYRRVSQNAY